MKKTTLFLFVILLTLATMGSDCGANNQGFLLVTQRGVFVNGLPAILVDPDREIFGYWENDFMDATGTRKNIPSFTHTNGFGQYSMSDGRAPARWVIGELSGPCNGKSDTLPIDHGTNGILCDTTCVFLPCNGHPPFMATPAYIDVSNPPPTVTITGFGIDATYGMPYVQYYDPDGNLVAQTQASETGEDGSWLSGATPDLSSVGSNSYWVVVANVASDGSQETIGATSVYIDSGQPPPPPSCNPSSGDVNACHHNGGEWDYDACYCAYNY